MIRLTIDPARLLEALGIEVPDCDTPEQRDAAGWHLAAKAARTLQEQWPLTRPEEGLAVKFEVDSPGELAPATDATRAALTAAVEATIDPTVAL